MYDIFQALWYDEGDLHPKILYILYTQSAFLNILSILLFVYFGVEAHRAKNKHNY